MSHVPLPATTKKLTVVTSNWWHGKNLSNGCWYKPARKTTIAGCQYMYQPPNALVGEATYAFFNIPKLNESLPFFKMVEKKNSWLFTSVNSFRVFSPCKKKSHHMKWKILWDFGLGFKIHWCCIRRGEKETYWRHQILRTDVCFHT